MSDELDFSTIIASAVHDMKNSLGMLLHSVDEVRESVPESVRQSESFTTLQYEAQRVHGDLVQLLGLYRLQQDKLSATVEEQIVPDFLEEQVARHQPLLEGMGIELTVNADAIDGYFDTQLVSGVLTNVINNAIRYTRERLQLSAREDEGYLVISVEDDGNGFPDQMLNAPLKGINSLDFKTGSTNLGLYFADRMARMHREADREGFIRLRNGGEFGGGVFELWLP